jgi:hypothetical protein
LLDRDVAELYGVQTREINQAVRNNPDKFPEGYVCELTKEESASLRSKILTLDHLTESCGSENNARSDTHKEAEVMQVYCVGEWNWRF